MMSVAFCAEPLVRLILTEKWLPCVLFLRVFCLSYICWPIITANLNAAKAVGRSDLYLKRQLMNEAVCILLLLATFRISVEAIAYGVLITNVVTQILDAQPSKKLIDYGYLEQMRDILPTLLAGSGRRPVHVSGHFPAPAGSADGVHSGGGWSGDLSDRLCHSGIGHL